MQKVLRSKANGPLSIGCLICSGDEAKTDQKLRRLWNAFSVQKRFARSNFTDFSSALFHHDVDGEMALHYLEHLTRKTVKKNVFFLTVYVAIHCLCVSFRNRC